MDPEKILILDLDGTVTPHSTWLALNTVMGVTPEQDQELFQQYTDGSLQYADWIRKLICIYHSKNSPLTRRQLIQLAEDINLYADAEEFVQSAQAKGYKVILVSGSVDILVERVAERLNTDGWLSCTKAVFKEDMFIDLVSMGDEGLAKIKLVKEAGIELSKNTISIGDGGNEKELFEVTRGVLIGANQTLIALAWKQTNNLTEAVDLLP